MKRKTIFYLAFVLLSFYLTSCSGNNNQKIAPQLEKVIQDSKKQLPMKITDDVEMESMFVESGFLVYSYNMLENSTSLADMSVDYTKETMKLGIANSKNVQFLEAIVESNLGLMGRYKGVKSGVTKEVTSSAEEVKQWLSDIKTGKSDDVVAYLKQCAMSVNADCPQPVDEITTMMECKFQDGNLCYYYLINEESISIEELSEFKDDLKNDLIQSMSDPTNMTTSFVTSKCKQANAKIVNVYKGNKSGKSLTIIYDPNIDKIAK